MNTHTTIKWIDNMMIVSESASSHAVAIDTPPSRFRWQEPRHSPNKNFIP